MSRSFGEFPANYELIDAGSSLKLERWGDIVTIRPELQAYFAPGKQVSSWREQAHWEFVPEKPASLNGKWKQLKKDAPASWVYSTANFSVLLETTGNKHLGIFPEQQVNWQLLENALSPEKKFLNLFAYTGASSLAAKSTGADVTHVDSVKAMIAKAGVNMELSGLSDIRWAVEDALKFVQRELKRGNKYDCIQMDPPAWGLGSKGEKWKLENLLPELLGSGCQLLNPGGTLILSTYSPKLELKDLEKIVSAIPNVKSECRELWLKTTTGKSLFYGLLAYLKS